MGFYQVNQNNSGGHFVVDKKVCHRLIIEADNVEEATKKAEELGCYWDGVENESDCPCCGDRWYRPAEYDELSKTLKRGWEAREIVYGEGSFLKRATPSKEFIANGKTRWLAKYGNYRRKGKLKLGLAWANIDKHTKQWSAILSFRSVKEYAQFMANEHGWTEPDIRIYYKNGKVDSISSNLFVVALRSGGTTIVETETMTKAEALKRLKQMKKEHPDKNYAVVKAV